MNKLPIAVSNPHAGPYVPSIVREFCRLTPEEIAAAGDEGAARIYTPLRNVVECYTSTPVSRAIIDMNRAPKDFNQDGVIKTHTCADVEIYQRKLTEAVQDELLDTEYHPYHERLTDCSTWGLKLGVDCHTMAAKGTPKDPDPGSERPHVCLSDLGGKSLPKGWMNKLVQAFGDAFQCTIAVNTPFPGGYIVQRHHKDMPWFQLQLSRAPFLPDEEKSRCVIQALHHFCQRQFRAWASANESPESETADTEPPEPALSED